MNRHTQIRQAVLARLREQCGDSATFFDGLPAFIDAQELPAVAVWLSDAQYTGKMTDEDDWQAVLHIAVFRGDFVKAVSKSFPKQAGTWGNTETPNGTVTVTISDDHNFDRQIIIPPIIFNGIAYSDPGSGNNPGGTRYTGYGFEVRKNGVLIASRETKGAIPGSYSAVIDMPSGRGSVTLEFKVFHKGNQRAGNITDCTVIVTKKAASGISIR